MQAKQVLYGVVLALAVSGVSAQSQAAGLWEHSFTMSSPGGEAELAMAAAQAKLAALPPEQRQQIEQMMARSGIKVSAGGTTTIQACVSKEEAAKPAEARLPGDCTQSDVKRKGSAMSFKFACSKPQPSSGEGDISFAGDKAYHGHSTINTQIAGRPQRMDLEMSGRWLAADCGDVKPRAAPGQ